MRVLLLCLALMALGAPALAAEPEPPSRSRQVLGASGALGLHLGLTVPLVVGSAWAGANTFCAVSPGMLCDAAGILLGAPVGLAGGTVLSAWINAQWLAHWAEAAGQASPAELFARGLDQGLWGAAAGAVAGFGVWLVMDDDLALDAAVVLVTGFGLVGWSLSVPVTQGILAFAPDGASPEVPAPVLMPLLVLPF